NPVMQYQSEEIGNDDSTGLHTVTISQQFVTANKLGIAQQVQSREYQKQLSRLRIEELRVMARVRTAFALGLVAQNRVDLTETIFDLARQTESGVNDLVEAEEASRLALLQAKVETEQAKINYENARSQYQATIRSLSAAVGDSTIAVSRLVGELPDPSNDRPWDSMLESLAASSPEMSLAGSELERAKWALQLACARVVPNVTGQAGVGYDAVSDDTFALIGVSVPQPIRNRNQGNIRSARADITGAAAAIDETRLSIEGRLARSVGQYEISRERYWRLTDSVIPAAEEAYELAKKAFEVGEADYLLLLTTQRTLFEKRLVALEALGQVTIASNEIDTLLVTLPF
ncbi:MAG: TolC family protein, partial [Planctomycetota bacterium]